MDVNNNKKKYANYVQIIIFLFLVIFFISFIATSQAASSPMLTELTTSELEWLAQNPIIKVAPDIGYAPVEFEENGKIEGIAIDYLDWMAKHYPIKFEIVRYSTWTEVLNAARSKQIDVVSGAAKTPERSTYLQFTKPYIIIPNVVLRRYDSPIINNDAEFIKLKIGTTKGYAVNEFVRLRYPNLQVYEFDKIEDQLRKLSTGELDAVVSEIMMSSYYISKLKLTNLVIEEKFQVDFPIELAMATHKDSSILNGILDKMLTSIPEDFKRSTEQKWSGINLNQGIPKSFFISLLISFSIVLVLSVSVIFWNKLLRSSVDEKTHELEILNKHLEEKVERRTMLLNTTNQQLELSMVTLQMKDEELCNINAELEASLLDLHAFQQKLVEVEKVAALGRLVATVAHEMNTPLGNSILCASYIQEQNNNLKLFLAQQKSPPKLLLDHSSSLDEAVHSLNRSLERAANLVSRFKSLAIRNLNQEEVVFDVKELFDECLQMYNYIKPVSALIEVKFSSKIIGIRAAYEEVFCNLISNSIIHGFSDTFDGDAIINAKIEKIGEGILIEYSDNGIGIDDNLLDKVLEPLFSTNRTGNSGGIGLNIITNLLNYTLGGTMKLDNSSQIGLKIIIEITKVNWE